MVGKGADNYIQGISHGKEGDPTAYIVNHFETLLQERFKNYFSAALPDVLIENIPLPRIDRSLAGFVKLQQSFLNQGQTAIEDVESDASKDVPIGSTAGEASTEAEAGFARIPPLRLVTTNLASKDVASPSATNSAALATPAPAIHSSATALTETAGITLQRPGKTGQATQTPSP